MDTTPFASRKRAGAAQHLPFDKYAYYYDAVQAPEVDAAFFYRLFLDTYGFPPRRMQEDFCGTYALCCEWVRLDPACEAVGVDLDPEPLTYGKTHYHEALELTQRGRVQTHQANVLDFRNRESCDLVCALNFSYFCLKSRTHLRQYLQNARANLGDVGLLILDCFGGSACLEPIEEETQHPQFRYFWDQKSFDPATAFAEFAIHFQRPGERKRPDVFTYDWRLWTLPELQDLLHEVGFARVRLLWEDTDEAGDGTGEFVERASGEPAEGWVAYLVAQTYLPANGAAVKSDLQNSRPCGEAT